MTQTPEAEQIPVSFVLNDKLAEVTVQPHVLLLDLLRDQFELKGAKRSCDVQVCGACTVLVNSRPVSSCAYLAFEVQGKEVLTIEGMASEGKLHPLQGAFMEHAALQCGYCTPGMVLAAKALLDETPRPTADEIIEYMKGNICRCTGYKKIVEAIQDAAQRLSGEKKPGAETHQRAGPRRHS